jgi:hypothetical protein
LLLCTRLSKLFGHPIHGMTGRYAMYPRVTPHSDATVTCTGNVTCYAPHTQQFVHRSKLNIAKDGQNQPTVNLAGNSATGLATGVNGAANGKQKYGFKDGGNDNFGVNPSSPDGTQGGIDSNPVCHFIMCTYPP